MDLSNEQIAHDIAIASLPIKYDIEKTKTLNHAGNMMKSGGVVEADISFDSIVEYKAIYSSVLKFLNEGN